MIFLVDTNVLVRLADRRAPERPLARAALKTLHRRGEDITISPQNVVEFWSVATRPVAVNGLALSLNRTDRALRRFESTFLLVPGISAIHDEWRRLVVAASVSGRQVHDARLVAVMRVHGITHLLTFNTLDFQRYPGITAVHPRDVGVTP